MPPSFKIGINNCWNSKSIPFSNKCLGILVECDSSKKV